MAQREWVADAIHYVRYRRHCTSVLCADPEHSVFYDYYQSVRALQPRPDLQLSIGSGIEGIGRPRVEPSFIAGCVDAMVKVPDALSLAAMRYITARLGRRVGGSTGTNFIGVLVAAQRMRAAGESGSIVTILCDSGERYSHSYYDPAWYTACRMDTVNAETDLNAALSGAEMANVKKIWSQSDCA